MQMFRLEQVLVEGRLPEDLVPAANELASGKPGRTCSSNCRCSGRLIGPRSGRSDWCKGWRMALQVTQNLIQFPFQIGRRLKSILWGLCQRCLPQGGTPWVEMVGEVRGRLLAQIMIDAAAHRAQERGPACKHEPEGRAE